MSVEAAYAICDQYVVDLSFESTGPKKFRAAQEGDTEVTMDVQVNGGVNDSDDVDDAGYYIDLNLHIESRVKGETCYIIEIKYRGEFDIMDDDLSEEEIKQIVLADVPQALFPFVRHEVARITAEGGFTPLRLFPISFSAEGAQPVESESDQQGGARRKASVH